MKKEVRWAVVHGKRMQQASQRHWPLTEGDGGSPRWWRQWQRSHSGTLTGSPEQRALRSAGSGWRHKQGLRSLANLNSNPGPTTEHLTSADLSCHICRKKSYTPSFHLGVGIPGPGLECRAGPGLTAHASHLLFISTWPPHLMSAHLIFSHLGRTGRISPHQTVKIESVSAWKMAHSKFSLIVSCIITARIFPIGCCEASRWAETLARCLAYCKHSINGSAATALLSVSAPLCISLFLLALLFFFFFIFCLLLCYKLQSSGKRTNPNTTWFIFLTPISVLIIIILPEFITLQEWLYVDSHEFKH